MIQEYIKNGKKYYKFRNIYIGKNPITKKEIRKSKSGFKTIREAKLYIANLQTKYEQNDYIEKQENKKTFQQIYNLWYENYKDTIKESTLYTHDVRVKTMLKELQNKELKNITPYYLQKYINNLSKKYKKGTILNIKSIINQVFNYAIKIGIIEKNPATLLTVPKDKDKIINDEDLFYTKEELQQFFKTLEKENNLKLLAIFRLLAFTGARIGEILALNWQDINFKEGQLHINKTLAKTKDGLKIQTPKTKTSNRLISLDKNTLTVLKKHKLNQKEEIFKKGLEKKDIVFTSRKNSYISINVVDSTFLALCKKHNLKKIKIHGFRHTHASLLFESGATIKAVQYRLGHSNIKTTMDIYTHVTKLQKENIGNDFAKYMEM